MPWYHFFGQALRGTELVHGYTDCSNHPNPIPNPNPHPHPNQVHGYTDCSNNELLLIDIERRVFSMPRYVRGGAARQGLHLLWLYLLWLYWLWLYSLQVRGGATRPGLPPHPHAEQRQALRLRRSGQWREP